MSIQQLEHIAQPSISELLSIQGKRRRYAKNTIIMDASGSSSLYYLTKGAATVVMSGDEGEEIIIKVDGLLAICLQHEIDHLDGKLFIDYLSRLKRDRAVAKVKKQARAA